MPRRPPLPPPLGRAFSVPEARSLGVSRSRLRATDLERPFHGGRSMFEPRDPVMLAGALAPLLDPDQRFSHLTAAELHGLRMPEGGRRPDLHVTGYDAARAMRRPLVRGHTTTLPVVRARTTHGLPASSPVDAWCECAELLQVDDLVVMGDGLVRRRNPIATVDELIAAVRRRARRRGAARLRRALELIRPGTDSARETLLRLMIVRAGFPEPEVNAPLLGIDGNVIAHGDLVWPRYRVVLEYDGRQHAEDARQFAIDIRRLDDIAAAGYRVIRVDRALFAARADLFNRISLALAAAGWRETS